jgi:integrase
MKGNRSLTRDEVRRISNLKECSSRDKALFVLMLNTAMRISETLSLKIKDVANFRGVIHPFLELQARNTKTRQGASIHLNSTARQALAIHVKSLLAKGLGLDDALFGGRKGQYKTSITRITAHNIFQKIYEMARVKGGKLATHAPRKTAAQFMYEATKNLMTVQFALRHSSINSTMCYLQGCLENVNNAFKNLRFT